jgi:hypothetical protein
LRDGGPKVDLSLAVRALGRIRRVVAVLGQLAGFVLAGAVLAVLVAETLFPELF